MEQLRPALRDKVTLDEAHKHVFPVGEATTRGEVDMLFRARDLQKNMYRVLRNYHNALFVFHRRAGKSRGLLMWLIDEALNFDMAGRGEDAPPRLMYVGVTNKSTKDILWKYLQVAALRIPGAVLTGGENPILAFANHATIRLTGSQNYDNLRGNYIDILIMDEFSYQNPAAYYSVLEPQLADYNGRTVIIGTPAGRNHFYRMHKAVLSGELKDWGGFQLSVTESGVFSPEFIEKEKNKYLLRDDEETWSREWECNFDAPIKGTFYGGMIRKMRQDGCITRVPHNPQFKVLTSWDLGIKDDTAIWFWQILPGGSVRVIDYMEGNNIALTDWVKRINALPYNYELAILPHDAAKRDQLTLVSFENYLSNLGVRFFILPRTNAMARIEAVRSVLQATQIDEDKCRSGIDALSLYRREYNEDKQVFMKNPVHNWCSHSADAFGYGAEFIAMKLGLKSPELLRAKIGKQLTSAELDRMLTGKSGNLNAMSRTGGLRAMSKKR